MINQITGNEEMTEQKLDRILHQAKASYHQKGVTGFFEYIRKIIPVSVSDEYMRQLMKQLQDPRYANQLLKQFQATNHQKRKK